MKRLFSLVRFDHTQKSFFHAPYKNSTYDERQQIISSAREYLINTMVDEVFPVWYGTKWDFNRTTRTLGEGEIACGYFVTNTQSDVGLIID